MRAAAILGLGCSAQRLRPFQADPSVEWRMGMPDSPDDADIVLIFGGDGTLHRHLGSLVRLGLPVLVVPAGSGNDFARALGIRGVRDSVAAWEGFCKGFGSVRTIDLGVITGCAGGAPHEQHFCCVAGVGLDSEVTRRANSLPRWVRGNGGYVLALLPTIFRFAPLPVKILTRPEDQSSGWSVRSDRVTTLAAFANTPVYGGGMKIAPQAKMDDGLIDICVVGGVDPFKLFCLFPTVYAGRHLKVAEVSYSQAERVRVETESPLDVYADGEFVCQTPAEMGIQRAALRVLTP
jgi:diacylglycerol kinase (ATP)